MRKIQYFFQDVKFIGWKYAVCRLFDLPYLFEDSRVKILRGLSDKAHDFCVTGFAELRSDAEEASDAGKVEPTPCGCTVFTDCRECGSYSVCHQSL